MFTMVKHIDYPRDSETRNITAAIHPCLQVRPEIPSLKSKKLLGTKPWITAKQLCKLDITREAVKYEEAHMTSETNFITIKYETCTKHKQRRRRKALCPKKNNHSLNSKAVCARMNRFIFSLSPHMLSRSDSFSQCAFSFTVKYKQLQHKVRPFLLKELCPRDDTCQGFVLSWNLCFTYLESKRKRMAKGDRIKN